MKFWFSGGLLKHPVWLLVALGSAFAGAALAWHHPVWPITAVLVFAVCCLLMWRRPGIWLFVVPACLPFLNFSPWTGWLIFEEFDLLLLATLAGGYARLACSCRADAGASMPNALRGLLLLLAGAGLLSLYRGFADAGGFAFDWFAGYADALNSLRVFKSLGFALLLVPLLRQEIAHSITRASQRLAAGMVAGLTVVVLAVIWERAAFPGLLDFSTPYRTVGLFWEMHVGGAAIDCYLALTTPFVVWALFATRRPVLWASAAALALLVGYASLTTFSRGVYLSVVASLVLLGVLLWAQKSQINGVALAGVVSRRNRRVGWRVRANLLLMLALVSEVAVVMTGGSFMTERLASAGRDLGSRVAHWRHGIDLLEGPADWLFGKGFGRLPSNYASHVPHGEFPGDVKLGDELEPGAGGNTFVTVSGPVSMNELGGQYALTQRVGTLLPGRHRVSLNIRSQKIADVYLALCERHLLYDGHCQTAFLRILPGKAAWQSIELPLDGPALAGGPWYAPRLSMFALSVVNAGGVADFDNVRLIGPQRAQWLENGDFASGLAHWFPAAQHYFLPWHIDNLFLELLIEQGAIGLLLTAVLVAYAFWHLIRGRARSQALSAYLAAALCALLLVGLVSSLMDVPRVSFLFYLLTLFSIQTAQGADLD